MPIAEHRSEHGRSRLRRPLGAAVVLALLAPALAACSDDLPPPTYQSSSYDEVARILQVTLDARAAALRGDDTTAFRATVEAGDRSLLRQQLQYFENVEQLPVRSLRLEVLADTITPVEGSGAADLAPGAPGPGADPATTWTGPEYWAEVTVALQLSGYDTAPARTRDRFLFRTSADGTAAVVASTTDREWEEAHPGDVQPWDLGPIRVREQPGVLGVFDDRTVGRSTAVMAAASQGRGQVRSVLGGDVGGAGGTAEADTPDEVEGVVVYALSDDTVLRGLTGRSVGDPDRADGLTVAVPADPTRPSAGTVSYRVFLNPRVLGEPREVVARLVRHELTHALLGPRGAGAPLWLTEGLAEYVSVRPQSPGERRLPAAALSVAGSATDLPRDAEFGGSEAEAWYAVAWWACEYISSAYGERTLLVLLDRLARGAEEAPVLTEVLGIDAGELVRRGADLMRATYGA